MWWLGGLVAVLFLAGIIGLAAGGTEPAHRIRSFSGTSAAEEAHRRRGARFQLVGAGLVFAGLAVVGAVLLR